MNLYSENNYVPERRLKPRIDCDCSAVIRGYDEFGKKFEEGGRVTNFSRIGMYVLLNREIPNGSELDIRMSLSTGIPELGTSSLVVRGTVVRGEICSEMIYGIGVKFLKYRFI